jgi:hypothetical protein
VCFANSLQSDPFSYSSMCIASTKIRRLWSVWTLSALQSLAVMPCFVASVLSGWILLYQFTFIADMISWSTRKRHVVYARLQWCSFIFLYLNETFILYVQVKVECDDNSEEREFPKIRRLSDLYRGPSDMLQEQVPEKQVHLTKRVRRESPEPSAADITSGRPNVNGRIALSKSADQGNGNVRCICASSGGRAVLPTRSSGDHPDSGSISCRCVVCGEEFPSQWFRTALIDDAKLEWPSTKHIVHSLDVFPVWLYLMSLIVVVSYHAALEHTGQHLVVKTLLHCLKGKQDLLVLVKLMRRPCINVLCIHVTAFSPKPS